MLRRFKLACAALVAAFLFFGFLMTFIYKTLLLGQVPFTLAFLTQAVYFVVESLYEVSHSTRGEPG